jgi:hypothetical protein
MRLGILNALSKLFKREKPAYKELGFEVVKAVSLDALVNYVAYAMIQGDYVAVIYEDLACGVLGDPIARNSSVKKYLIPVRRLDALVYLVKRRDALEVLRQQEYHTDDNVVAIEVQWNSDKKTCQMVSHYATNEEGKRSIVQGVLALVQILNTVTTPEKIEFKFEVKPRPSEADKEKPKAG